MYIQSVELENFKAHKHKKINFENINVIVGKNAKGKTTILDAISYALYGVTADGATKKELLTNANCFIDGEKIPKNGKVIVTFDNGYILQRDLNSSVQLFDNNGVKISEKSTEVENWLNIPKDMFMTLIYGIQGKMTDAFLKFNASQKDFIDNLFSINNYMDPINEKLSNVLKELDYEYASLNSLKNNKINGEAYFKSSLQNLNCNSLEELKEKIEEIEKQISLFGDIEKVEQIKREQSEIKSKFDYANTVKTNLQNDLTRLENEIKPLQEKFVESVKVLQETLNVEITDVTTDFIIKDVIKKTCDINMWYDNLHNTLQNINETTWESMKTSAIEILNYIRQIDEYRNYYQQLMNNWWNLKMQISNNNKNVSNVKMNIENIVANSNMLSEKLKIVNESLSTIGAEGEGTSISIYRNLISTHSMMKSQYESLSNYLEQINRITFDENKLNEIINKRNIILNVAEIFKREGFPQYMRNAYIKDVAAMMNEMLMNFGFDSLLPVTVTESGEFLYRGVKTKSISGAQKICTSIIQKFIYGRILAPGMKLGLMILDEPTYGMDSTRVEYLKEFLTTLNKTLGLQLIIVTHKPEIIPENAHVISL